MNKYELRKYIENRMQDYKGEITKLPPNTRTVYKINYAGSDNSEVIKHNKPQPLRGINANGYTRYVL